MGGLARTAGASRLSGQQLGKQRLGEPRWLVGAAATLAIAPDAPTLWLVDIDDPASRRRAEAIAPLPGEAALFAARGDAGRRLLRRRLARLMLAQAAGCGPDAVVVGRSDAGAPIVVSPAGWHVSVAARWPDCLIGIAPMVLGVDLERLEPDQPPEPELLTRHERDRLRLTAAADRPRLFARAWTAKESHAKWTGEPLKVAPALVDTEEARVSSPWGETRCWRYEAGDLVAAVCTGGRPATGAPPITSRCAASTECGG